MIELPHLFHQKVVICRRKARGISIREFETSLKPEVGKRRNSNNLDDQSLKRIEAHKKKRNLHAGNR